MHSTINLHFNFCLKSMFYYRLYLATYNVGTSNPEQRLLDFLSISSQKNEKLPDFFVIGLQEVKSQPQNMLMDTLFDVSIFFQFTCFVKDISV